MKILKYKVAGALYQAETGPQAQVGDQVKMFLDQEANPELPEFVFGIIQPGISKSGCCEDFTVYSIEYELEGFILRPDDILTVTTTAAVDVVAEDLGDEAAARIAGDAALTTALGVETAARVAGDIADRAYAIQRANHTGTQAQSTVVNLVSDLALKAPLAGATLTNVTLSSGTIQNLGFGQIPVLGMANNQPSNNGHVAEARATRIPLGMELSVDPDTVDFVEMLGYPDNYMNSSANSIYYGRYWISGTVNGKTSYEGGLVIIGSPMIKVTWDGTSKWVAEPISGGSGVTWSKTSANLTDSAAWVPSSGPQGQATGDLILSPQMFLPGQPMWWTDTPTVLYIRNVANDGWNKSPMMGATISVYADDAAAAVGGVVIGDFYKKTGGTVAWRQA